MTEEKERCGESTHKIGAEPRIGVAPLELDVRVLLEHVCLPHVLAIAAAAALRGEGAASGV